MLEVRWADWKGVIEGDLVPTGEWGSIEPGFVGVVHGCSGGGFSEITYGSGDTNFIVGERVAVVMALQFAKQTQRPVLVEGVDNDGANPGAATVAAWRALDLRIAKALDYPPNAYYPTYPEALAACEKAESAAERPE